MENQRQFLKFLKFIRRRGALSRGTHLLGMELRGLRRRYGLSVLCLSEWLDVSADVLTKVEEDATGFVDGVIWRKILEHLSAQWSESEDEVTPVEQSVTSSSHHELDVIQPTSPVLLCPKPPSPEDIFDFAAGLSRDKFKTDGQMSMAVCEEWARLNNYKKWDVTKAQAMPRQTMLRIAELLGAPYRQLMSAWSLFRHYKKGSRPKDAVLKVRSGELSAHTALLDYDKLGWSPRATRSEAKRRKATAQAAKKRKSAKQKVAKQKVDKKPDKVELPKTVKPQSPRKLKTLFRGAESAQNAVGSLVLKLTALKAEFFKDEELVRLIEGITQAVAKPHHELKRIVLLRATKLNSTPRRAP